MKTLQLTICAIIVSAGFADGGIKTSPWAFSKIADEWSMEDKDQEIAAGTRIEFMISGAVSAVRLVALSSSVKKKDDSLRGFAKGVQKSFARNGVIDLKESKAAKWGFQGLSMTFEIPSETAKVNCDAFFFKHDGKFWAIMAFGSERAKLAKAFLTLKVKSNKPSHGR